MEEKKPINYYEHNDPMRPPDGFRLMREDEIVRSDDLCCCPYGTTKMAWFRVGGAETSHPCFGKTVKENQGTYPHVTGWATPGSPHFCERLLTTDIIQGLVENDKLEEVAAFIQELDKDSGWEFGFPVACFTTIDNRGMIDYVPLPSWCKFRG